MQAHLQERAGYHAQLVSKDMANVRSDIQEKVDDTTYYQTAEITWVVPKSKIPRSGSTIIRSQAWEVTAGTRVYLRIAIDANDGVKFGLCEVPDLRRTNMLGSDFGLESERFCELYMSIQLYDSFHNLKTLISLEHKGPTRMSMLDDFTGHQFFEQALTRFKVKKLRNEDADDLCFEYEDTDEVIPVTRSDFNTPNAEDSFEIFASFKIAKFISVTLGCV
jgi:hypothetical protein